MHTEAHEANNFRDIADRLFMLVIRAKVVRCQIQGIRNVSLSGQK